MKKILLFGLSLFLFSCVGMEFKKTNFDGLSYQIIAGEKYAVFDNPERLNFAYIDKQSMQLQSLCGGQWLSNAPQLEIPIIFPAELNGAMALPIRQSISLMFEKRQQSNHLCPPFVTPNNPGNSTYVVPGFGNNPCIVGAGCAGGFGRVLQDFFNKRTILPPGNNSTWKCNLLEQETFKSFEECDKACKSTNNSSRIIATCSTP